MSTPRRPRHNRVRRRQARRTRAVITMVATTAIVATGAATVVSSVLGGHPESDPATAGCTVTYDGVAWRLDLEQADNAALIAARSIVAAMPARAATIALATAYQESWIRNLDYGDLDSLGLFQQRPSQGWGTPEQVTDPVFATDAFYAALDAVPGYTEMAVTEAAQAVQRSAYPDRYANHEGMARAWAATLTGYLPGAIACTITTSGGQADTAEAAVTAVTARLARDLPTVAPGTDAATGTITIDASAAASALGVGADQAERIAQAIAAWAVATASTTGAVQVSTGDLAWLRSDGQWHQGAADAAAADHDQPNGTGTTTVIIRVAVVQRAA